MLLPALNFAIFEFKIFFLDKIHRINDVLKRYLRGASGWGLTPGPAGGLKRPTDPLPTLQLGLSYAPVFVLCFFDFPLMCTGYGSFIFNRMKNWLKFKATNTDRLGQLQRSLILLVLLFQVFSYLKMITF